jgi:hypothetical protein
MCNIVSPPFTVTPPEVLHIRHYVWDVIQVTDPDHRSGPATHWLWDNDIFPTTMQPFQLAAQRSILDWYTWLDEPPPLLSKPPGLLGRSSRLGPGRLWNPIPR